MSDDHELDRKFAHLIERLKRGEALMQGPRTEDDDVMEDIGISVRSQVIEETREQWEGEPLSELRHYRQEMQERRSRALDRAKRYKNPDEGPEVVGSSVEDTWAKTRLDAEIYKWKATAVKGLISSIRDEGPPTDSETDSDSGRPKTTAELRATLSIRDECIKYVQNVLRNYGQVDWKEAYTAYLEKCEEANLDPRWSSTQSMKNVCNRDRPTE